MSSNSDSIIDWDDAKRRVSELGKTLSRSQTVSAAEAESILLARADRLAKAVAQEKPSDDRMEVMILDLAGECYALETRLIREVITPASLTPLPGTPSQFAGVMNLRGRPLLIIDGRVLLGLSETDASESQRIVVIGQSQIEFGLLTDGCDEVVALDVSGLADPPLSLDETARRLIRGVTGEATIVLDSDQLTGDSRLWIDENED